MPLIDICDYREPKIVCKNAGVICFRCNNSKCTERVYPLMQVTKVLEHCPDNCAKKTFCHKGEPLPEDKISCYTIAYKCLICKLPKSYINEKEVFVRIPHPKNTEQYWKGKVCSCPK